MRRSRVVLQLSVSVLGHPEVNTFQALEGAIRNIRLETAVFIVFTTELKREMDLMNLKNPFSQKNYRAFYQKVKGLPDETKKETPFSTKLLECREESALVTHAIEKKRLYEINELPAR